MDEFYTLQIICEQWEKETTYTIQYSSISPISMTQKNSVDMSEYRQQQALLNTSNVSEQNIRASLIDESVQSMHGELDSSHHSDQQLLNNENAAPIQNVQAEREAVEPNILQNPPQNINANMVMPQSPYSTFKKITDFAVFVCIICYYMLYSHEISKFGLIYIVYFILHYGRTKFNQEINRAFVVVLYFWAAWGAYTGGVSALTIDQKIYCLLYIIQVVPNAIKCCIGCCIVSCTCLCATCCFCCCAYAQLKRWFEQKITRHRTKGTREKLCREQLSQIQDRQCPICLQSGKQMTTQKCHHSFHPQCLFAWLQQHKTCPMCRTTLY